MSTRGRAARRFEPCQARSVQHFVLFGRDHLVALSLIAIATVGLVSFVRRRPGAAAPLRYALAATLLVLTALSIIWLRRAGMPWSSLAPLNLCDAAIAVAIWALLTSRPLACEVIYFWGAAGTLLAVVTPDVSAAFPAPEFLMYFALHGAVIVTAFLIPYGLRHAPRRGAVWRMLLCTNVYAAFVAVVDFTFDVNFMYLRAKPPGPTPLDWFGPWPWYVLVGELVALGLFTLLWIPFRATRQTRRLDGSGTRL